jgi:enoyl-[acyl-carrier protein] reductase II
MRQHDEEEEAESPAAGAADRPPPLPSRVARRLGVDYPIVQAPMGFIARARLASAVSNAGGLGVIETSSGRLGEIRDEIAKMADLTDRPWGVNIAQLFVTDPGIVDFVADHGVRFVTTSAGDPARFTAALKDAGITVFHVVPSLKGALKAVDAGVDGLVVEGVEGGGFKSTRGVSTMVLVPLVASRVEVPVIAAGGIADGASMAAAFALGAEGVQMGTRMVSAAESPVHDNYKQLVVGSDATDTVLLSRFSSPAYRVLRTAFSQSLEREERVAMGDTVSIESVLSLYFEGDLDAAFAFGGQVAGRIDRVKTVAEIVHETVRGFYRVVASLGSWLGGAEDQGPGVRLPPASGRRPSRTGR